MTIATAPGKVILFGEHAVVYGQPAIAAPVSDVRATARIEEAEGGGVRIVAPDMGQEYRLSDAGSEDPLATAVRLVQKVASLDRLPDLTISVTSNVPIASGLGSGAATAAALIRALARHLRREDLAQDGLVSALTYEVEKIHHGTPSGIDNTVVALEKPVFFVRQQPHNRVETFRVAKTLHLLIGDTGRRNSTKEVVGDVRRQWQAQTRHFEELFTACGRISRAARSAIEAGDLPELGRLMRENHVVLQQMTVSSPELDRLVQAAGDAGALGAKLSGGGRGGNMVALVEDGTKRTVTEALLAAGAVRVIASDVN
jgi:mevalonate kinase